MPVSEIQTARVGENGCVRVEYACAYGCGMPITSLPDIMAGTVWAWMGMGFSYSSLRSTANTFWLCGEWENVCVCSRKGGGGGGGGVGGGQATTATVV